MFDRLPDDVLLLIFSALHDNNRSSHDPDRHIRAVRLVDHRCYNVASLILMRSVTVNGSPGSLKTFLAISMSPALAARVENLVYDARVGSGGISSAKAHAWNLNNGRDHHSIKVATAIFLQRLPHLFPLLGVGGDERAPGLTSRHQQPLPLNLTNYEIYQTLVQGLSGFPALRCVKITTASHSGAMHPPRWRNQARNDDGTLSSQVSVADTGSVLFVLLRALYAANTRPRQFVLAAAPGQRYHHMVSRSRISAPSPEHTFSDRLVPLDIECARKVFSRLQHFDITIQGPDLEDDEEQGDIFLDSLSSFITSAGKDLRTLKIQVYDMPLLVVVAGQSITSPSPWSSLLFAVIPDLWHSFTELHLEGVDLDGRDLIVLLWKCPGIMALTLKHVYLTNSSPRWAEILDELFLLLRDTGDGVNAGTESRLLIKPGHVMEGIEFTMDEVYEPMDEFLEWPLYFGCQELNDFFTGRTGNPLRYEDEHTC